MKVNLHIKLFIACLLTDGLFHPVVVSITVSSSDGLDMKHTRKLSPIRIHTYLSGKWTQWFITLDSKVCHWNWSWSSLIYNSFPHNFNPILVLPSHLLRGFVCGYFLRCLYTRIVVKFPIITTSCSSFDPTRIHWYSWWWIILPSDSSPCHPQCLDMFLLKLNLVGENMQTLYFQHQEHSFDRVSVV
jgi:hypothetical protein